MNRNNKHSRRKSGFTLIEVVTSLAVMSVLMLGLSGAIMIGAHAIPTTTETGLADQTVIDVLDELRTELRGANTISFQSSTGSRKIILVMKETEEPGAPSKVEYEYNAGLDILKRKVDIQGVSTILEGVDTFVISTTMDGSNARVVSLLISVKDTIQRNFELHALLPDKPGVI